MILKANECQACASKRTWLLKTRLSNLKWVGWPSKTGDDLILLIYTVLGSACHCTALNRGKISTICLYFHLPWSAQGQTFPPVRPVSNKSLQTWNSSGLKLPCFYLRCQPVRVCELSSEAGWLWYTKITLGCWFKKVRRQFTSDILIRNRHN